MPQYKIIDYVYPTIAELARAILDYSGVEYEDVKFEQDKAADAEKAAPYGRLPTLEVDGKLFSHQQSMCRYLAKQHGLAGKDNKESAMCDVIMEGLWDMFSKMRKPDFYQLPREQRMDIIKKMCDEDVTRYLDFYEALLKKRDSDAGYAVGKDVTWSDIGLTLAFAALQFRHGVSLDGHPQLKAYLSKMVEIPALAEFLAARAHITDY